MDKVPNIIGKVKSGSWELKGKNYGGENSWRELHVKKKKHDRM